MARPLFDSEYIFGIYEPGGEQYMLAANRPGWVLFSEAVGHDPEDRTGVDFTPTSDLGLGVICRINNGYEPQGTLPHSSQYEQFARRVANFVATSRGCKIWVIGNEMNYAAERPGIVIDWSRHNTTRTGPAEEADPSRRGVSVRFNALPDRSTEIRTTRAAIVNPGEVITPELYAHCYRLCREAVHRLPGHENDQVLVGAVAPWNTQSIYPGNANGDWVQYFRDILDLLGPEHCDGFTLHTYTRGGDPLLISLPDKLGPPFQSRHAQFRAFQDFMHAVPANMRHLPAYITEVDQIAPWENRDSGWVQRAYAEVDAWNQQPGNQPIRAMLLYRWPRLDRWHIEGKQGVIDDFRAALENDYRWQKTAEAAPAPSPAPPARPGKARRQKPAKPAALPSYRIAWLDDRFPPKLRVGETITVPLTLRNEGSLTWNWGGGNPFRLGYHYYRGRRRLAMPAEKDVRTDVPADVPPGAEVTLDAVVSLPDEPGNYTLEFDLVQEGVTWFKEQGSPVLTRWLTVEAAEPAADGDGPLLPVPLFTDISARLPHSGAYARRSLDQVRYLVINHTGGHPRLSLDRIAEAHVRRGYPGIVYDFVVDSAGQVFRTSNLEDVAEPGQLWSLQGVNIGLAGNFNHEPPPLAQLDATSRLCAWLARNLNLGPDTIVGLGELTRTDSPGRTFYRGPNWQATLQRQVQLHLAVLASGGEEARGAEQGALAEELRSQNRALEGELVEERAALSKLRVFNERLQAELADLRQQLTARPEEGDSRPPIQNYIHRLPRDARRYMPRDSASVRYIVINHTGVPPAAALQRIAEAHLPDWPGILYDFVIDDQGIIRQTQPLDEVVDTGEPYLANAINIAFAGQFDSAAPTNEQIYAGGRLIAWLLTRFPQTNVDAIKGLCEFIEHTSPGKQWLDGRRWKETLVASVRRAAGMIDPTESERELRGQLEEVERQKEIMQHNLVALQEQRQRLQADNQRLQAELTASTAQSAAFVTPKPALRNIVDQLPHHPTLRYERRALNQITHIAVHHTATLPTIGPTRIAELHVSADPGRGKEAWPGIGYHYFVHADGSIDQTNHLETVSQHVFQHSHYTVGVVFAGSFMNGKTPTTAQLRSGAHLIAWLMQELNVPLARVWGHKEFPDNITVCPGSEWTGGLRWRDMLYERIQEIQSGVGIKSLRHYMLFWQRQYPGPVARQDFVNAIGYVARFRPTVGFSVEEARTAEYVTIVGGEAGVSASTERVLREGGCKVERIAGRNEEETSRMLAEMVRLGRRFRSFEVDF